MVKLKRHIFLANEFPSFFRFPVVPGLPACNTIKGCFSSGVDGFRVFHPSYRSFQLLPSFLFVLVLVLVSTLHQLFLAKVSLLGDVPLLF